MASPVAAHKDKARDVEQSANLRRRGESGGPPEVVDGVVAGGTRATIFVTLRAMMVSKLRTSFRILAFKSFNPSKMSSFEQLRVTKEASKPWWENLRHILKTEGFKGIHQRTMPVLLGNYLNSMVLFSSYAKLCDVPLNVNDDAILMSDSLHTAESGKAKKEAIRHVLFAGAVAGAVHGTVASSTRFYIDKCSMELRTRQPQPSVWPMLRTAAAYRKIVRMTAVDAAAYSVFFGAFEFGKQIWLPPIKAWVNRQSWIADKQLVTISGTALAAGGAAGLGYTVIKFPSMWIMDGKQLASAAFRSEFVASTLKSFGPNAVTFLVLEVLLYKMGVS